MLDGTNKSDEFLVRTRRKPQRYRGIARICNAAMAGKTRFYVPDSVQYHASRARALFVTQRTPFLSLDPSEVERTADGPPALRKHPFVVQYQTALEKDFWRILTTIQSLWGYPELNSYFRKLALDNRGDREGFPKMSWKRYSL